MKVLLAIDESKFANIAVQTVIAQFRPQDTEARVVHVTEPITFVFPPEMAAEYAPPPRMLAERKEQLRRAEELVKAAADKLRAAGFTVDTAVYEGDPRAEIIDMAEKWHADVIVVGSHGRKGLQRFLIGSVSEYVVRHAGCSVEIVRAQSKA